MDNGKTIRAREAARRLGVTVQWVGKLVKRGELISTRTEGGWWHQITVASVNSYKDKMRRRRIAAEKKAAARAAAQNGNGEKEE